MNAPLIMALIGVVLALAAAAWGALNIQGAGMHGLYLDGYVQNCTFDTFMAEKCGLNGVKLQGAYPGEGD